MSFCSVETNSSGNARGNNMSLNWVGRLYHVAGQQWFRHPSVAVACVGNTKLENDDAAERVIRSGMSAGGKSSSADKRNFPTRVHCCSVYFQTMEIIIPIQRYRIDDVISCVQCESVAHPADCGRLICGNDQPRTGRWRTGQRGWKKTAGPTAFRAVMSFFSAPLLSPSFRPTSRAFYDAAPRSLRGNDERKVGGRTVLLCPCPLCLPDASMAPWWPHCLPTDCRTTYW